MGPRDSLKKAMKQRLVSKALAAQQLEFERKLQELQVDRFVAPETPTPAKDHIDITSVYSPMGIGEAIAKELKEMAASGAGPDNIAAPTNSYICKPSASGYGAYTRLLHEARIQSESNIESIETTLDLLNAMEGLSPHVSELKKQMDGKRAWAHGKRMNLLGLEEIEVKRQEEWSEIDKEEEERRELEKNEMWPLRN